MKPIWPVFFISFKYLKLYGILMAWLVAIMSSSHNGMYLPHLGRHNYAFRKTNPENSV